MTFDILSFFFGFCVPCTLLIFVMMPFVIKDIIEERKAEREEEEDFNNMSKETLNLLKRPFNESELEEKYQQSRREYLDKRSSLND